MTGKEVKMNKKINEEELVEEIKEQIENKKKSSIFSLNDELEKSSLFSI